MAITRVTYGITTAPVNVIAYGATGDGVTDDTAAINAALAANKHVVVPVGTYLISDTIVVPASTRLEFLGGTGNSAVNAGAYFIKKSTMTTAGIAIDQAGVVTGGGLLGQAGNTGTGVWVRANAAVLSNFWVKSIGGVGVHAGSDTTVYRNVNKTRIQNVAVSYCTSHGILVDDQYRAANDGPPDANAGTVVDCASVHNGGSGIYIGYAWWVTVQNNNCENNTGYGLYLSGVGLVTTPGGTQYPACRWATVLGGDYNEGNTGGVVYDASYFSTFVNPDGYNLPTTAPNGLPGSALRNYIGSIVSTLQGLTTKTYQNVFDVGANVPAVRLQTTGTNSVGDGSGIGFWVDPGTGTYREQGRIKGYQLNTTQDGLYFYANNAGSLTNIFAASYYYTGVTPGLDNTYNLGHPSFRWGTVYAATGTINTSDENEKTDIEPLDYKEKAVALAIKARIKKFKFKDAVEAKGNKARIHFGVLAQDVKSAFEAEGLNADDYGVFCSDKLEDGSIRLGVRYDELYAFILGAI